MRVDNIAEGYAISRQHPSKRHASGHRVTVFDNLSTGHTEAVRWGELIQGDLLVTDDIERAFSQRTYSAVMHFSAKSQLPAETRQVNPATWNASAGQ